MNTSISDHARISMLFRGKLPTRPQHRYSVRAAEGAAVRKPAAFVTYLGNVESLLGEVKGPTYSGELVTAVSAAYRCVQLGHETG
jgi:hypothetical protein